MKRKLCVVAMLALVMNSMAQTEPLDVYICAGQSNMAGAGEKTELPAELLVSQTNVFIFDGGKWISFEPGPKRVGPEVSFVYTLQRALNRPIGIIKYAKGGTNLAKDWNPADPESLYSKLKATVTAARQVRKINIKGMIWMQGENDSKYEEMATVYSQNLDNLIRTARKDFDSPEMPFVAGRVNPPYKFADQVRTAQETCTTEPYAYINCDDLSRTDAGGLHYDTAGLVEMGKRFAQKMLKPD